LFTQDLRIWKLEAYLHTHTLSLSLSKYVKKICVLCGRGGERRGEEGRGGKGRGDDLGREKHNGGVCF
jgi:hypothetical protein